MIVVYCLDAFEISLSQFITLMDAQYKRYLIFYGVMYAFIVMLVLIASLIGFIEHNNYPTI